MTNYTGKMRNLLQLRAKVDAAIRLEARRQGAPLPSCVAKSKGIGYVVLPAPDLAHAAAQIAAAAEGWAQR